MMFLWLVFLIPLFIYLFSGPGEALRGGRVCHTAPPQGPTPRSDDPIAILRRRLARGEITPAEFEAMRRSLGG